MEWSSLIGKARHFSQKADRPGSTSAEVDGTEDVSFEDTSFSDDWLRSQGIPAPLPACLGRDAPGEGVHRWLVGTGSELMRLQGAQAMTDRFDAVCQPPQHSPFRRG